MPKAYEGDPDMNIRDVITDPALAWLVLFFFFFFFAWGRLQNFLGLPTEQEEKRSHTLQQVTPVWESRAVLKNDLVGLYKKRHCHADA